MTKIGYLGPRGTFSQVALQLYLKRQPGGEACEWSDIAGMLMAVQTGELDAAVVPIENSLEGAINVTLDMLAFDVDLKVVAEVVVPIQQCLLAPRGTALASIHSVLSHPQALGQCRKWLKAQLPQAVCRQADSTAEAAQLAAAAAGGTAALGSVLAADVYGLEILAQGIQDGVNNQTRFVVLSRSEGACPSGPAAKTSIVFTTENKPGSLYRVLNIFDIWGVNMSRIESRPSKDKLGSYVFFVDLEGHCDDPDLSAALTMVRRKTSFYKFLGSYPGEPMPGERGGN